MLDEFARYEQLGIAADLAFEKVQSEYADAVSCKRGCTDCCHALFGLFPIEAAYLRDCFEKLDPALQQEVLKRADRAEQQLTKFQAMMEEAQAKGAEIPPDALARERIRCPLLNNQGDCVLYSNRPVTCRAYGIPTTVQGAGRTCWKATFEAGKPYPAFNVDRLHRELYEMSRSVLEKSGQPDLTRAGLLITVSAALKASLENLVRGFGPETK